MTPFRLLSILAVSLCFSGIPLANANNANRQIIPLGEGEAFLANTGTGRANDTGAVYYNPAGLAELKSGRVSMTGSVYLSFNIQTDAFAHLDNTDIGYQASGFNTIPAFYVAAFRFDDWSAAFSVLVPDSLQVENRVPFTTPNTQGNLVQSSRTGDLWLGVSMARRLNSEWSVGASLYGIQHQEASSVAVDIGFPLAPTTKLVSSLQQMNLNVLGLSAILGVSYVPASWVSLGFRAQTPLVALYGKADTFQTNHVVNAGTITTTTEDKPGSPASFQLPVDMTLGAALSSGQWLTFLADVSLQLGTNYSTIPGSVLNQQVDLQPTPRLNLGLELKPIPTFPIRTGFYFNPSANGTAAGTEGFVSENYYGLTAGVGLNSSRVETGIGGFYIWSTGQTTPIGSPGKVSQYTSRGLGALLTATYLL